MGSHIRLTYKHITQTNAD